MSRPLKSGFSCKVPIRYGTSFGTTLQGYVTKTLSSQNSVYDFSRYETRTAGRPLYLQILSQPCLDAKKVLIIINKHVKTVVTDANESKLDLLQWRFISGNVVHYNWFPLNGLQKCGPIREFLWTFLFHR